MASSSSERSRSPCRPDLSGGAAGPFSVPWVTASPLRPFRTGAGGQSSPRCAPGRWFFTSSVVVVPGHDSNDEPFGPELRFFLAPTVLWCSCDSGPTITPSPEGGAPSVPSVLVHVFPVAGFATPPPASAPSPAFPAEDSCALALVSVAGLHSAVLCT